MRRPARRGPSIGAGRLARLLTPVLLAASLLAGCGGDGILDGPNPGALVTFRRTGGLGGSDDRLTVGEHGEVRVVRGGARRQQATGTLPAAELGALRHRLAAADFPHLPRRSVSEQVRDGYEYTLSYEGKTVTAGDGAIPPRLAPVIAQLTDVLARFGA